MMVDWNAVDAQEALEVLINHNGVPWIANGAKNFLEDVLTKNSDVLEAGSGASTIWLAGLVRSVFSYEEKASWYMALKAELERLRIKNVILVYDPDYVEEILPEIRKSFDVVLIDAPGGAEYGDRSEVMKFGVRFLKPNGYLVLDNSNRVEAYVKGLSMMEQLGWQVWHFNSKDIERATDNPQWLYTSIWRRDR